MNAIHNTREAWLGAAVEALRTRVDNARDAKGAPVGATVPGEIRVSVGFPSKAVRKRIGECWHASADGKHAIFISPLLHDPVRILDVLLHELCHAALPKETGHKGAFKRLALAVGLTGKMTETVATDMLRDWLANTIAPTLGDFPHSALALDDVKKQTTRLLKAECGLCGCTVRVTQKWLDTGTPACFNGECSGHGELMEHAG